MFQYVSIRFSGPVRKGLRFRRKFEELKKRADTGSFQWYPYDCFSNLFYAERLLRDAGLSWEQVAGTRPVLDVGAADGALSFFLESLGHQVHACDYSGANVNRMQGIRTLAAALGSEVQIHDIDLDSHADLPSQYGAALFLGTLYHVKNPFYVLETLARHTDFCFVSTRVARWTPDRTVSLDGIPVAYLLDRGDCNTDPTNYWIFSPPGLRLLVKRAGWTIRAEANSGPIASDPVSQEGDERMFLLLENETRPSAPV